MTRTRPVRRLVRHVAVTVVAVAAIGAVAVAAFGVGGAEPGTEEPRTIHVSTSTVTRRTLTDTTIVDGKLGYGVETPVASRATGTVTWLPAVGTVVSRGETLFRVDDQPIVLLYGPLPMYRNLATGVKGDDVKQFKQNLKALGYAGLGSDDAFTDATAAAVKRWQKALKRQETGSVAAADVIYAAGPLRAARQSARLGAAAAADVLMVTTTRRIVTVDVPTDAQRVAQLHNAVTVILPDGRQLKGEVISVGPTGNHGGDGGGDGAGTDATSNAGTGPPLAGQAVRAEVEVADQAALGTLDSGSVQVRYVAETHTDVLTVPVQALLALADGGFGLEIHEGASRRVVAVRVGLFAGGQVEVSGDGITEGTTVGVAG